ncbi:unnamed protein product [Adineta steineri]|uniref:Uncharacterized protein n=1 Tax=Adineta steineri TaxID=433720 RepID=A0A819LXM1_9BILA|nr:unnamed protein product [Adineta steineri]CAF3970075.1 unnamed protein product [Adineta steineri]
MCQKEQRKRSRSVARRLRYVRCVSFFMLGFFSSTITFLITFYATSNALSNIISSIFFSNSYNSVLQFPLSPRDAVKNYQPRDFLGKKKSINYDYYLTYNDFNYRKPETLTYKSRTYSNNTEILFRFPKKTAITAILLMFHSCKHSAYEWFHTPERQRIIGAALDLGYACLVFQSTDKITKCWSNDVDLYQNKDIQMVLKGLEEFYKEYPQLVSIPRYTFGVSSGGIFSSILAINQQYRIQGQIIFISIILPEILYTYVKAQNYPPTVWIHMLRDVEFASEERIKASKQIFMEQNIPCNDFLIEPLQVKPTIFSERVPTINSETSYFIYYLLLRNQWLNTHTYLIYNPRRKLAWQDFLFPQIEQNHTRARIYKSINDHKNEISEFLNTIYGEHEISYERSSEALNWFKELFTSSVKKT